MWKRRRILQTGLATLLSAAAPLRAFSQPKPRVKVRYNEVVRSMLYAPAYVALAKGFFEELGMDVALATAFGGDKSVAVMLTNHADIALIGPESAIYVQNSDSPTKIPIFCGLTSTDGFMLMGRQQHPAKCNTVHFSTLMAFSMLIGGSELCVRRRSGKLLIFRLTPRGFRRLRLEPTRSCRISSSTAS